MPQQQTSTDAFDPLAYGAKPHKTEQKEFDPLAEGAVPHQRLTGTQQAMLNIAGGAKDLAVGAAKGVAGAVKAPFQMIGTELPPPRTLPETIPGYRTAREMVVKPMQEQARLAREAPKWSAEQIARGVASGFPVAGPMAAQAVDDIRSGRPPGEVIGEFLGYGLAGEAAGKLLGRGARAAQPSAASGESTRLVESIQQTALRQRYLTAKVIEPGLGDLKATQTAHPEFEIPRGEKGAEGIQALADQARAEITQPDIKNVLAGHDQVLVDQSGVKKGWEAAKVKAEHLHLPTKHIDSIIEGVSQPTTVGNAMARLDSLTERLDATVRSMESGRKKLGNFSPVTQGDLVEMASLRKGILDSLPADKAASLAKLWERDYSLMRISQSMEIETSSQPFARSMQGETSEWLRGVGGYSLIRGAMTGNLVLAATGIGELVISKGPGFWVRKFRGGPAKVFESRLRKAGSIPIPTREEAAASVEGISDFDKLVDSAMSRGMAEADAIRQAVRLTREKYGSALPQAMQSEPALSGRRALPPPSSPVNPNARDYINRPPEPGEPELDEPQARRRVASRLRSQERQLRQRPSLEESRKRPIKGLLSRSTSGLTEAQEAIEVKTKEFQAKGMSWTKARAAAKKWWQQRSTLPER